MVESDVERGFDEVMDTLGHRRSKRQERDALLETLPGLSVEAESPDGAVRVTVNGDGVLTSIELGDTATAMSTSDAVERVLEAYRSAHQSVARQAGDLLASSGDHGGFLAQQYVRWQQTRPARPGPRAGQQDDEEDDFDVMRQLR